MPYKNPQKAKEYARQYARKHREERKISSRLWRQKNPERANAICKKYREKHRDERNKRIREQLAQRRKEPEFMFKQYKAGAKQRGHKWALVFKQFMAFWQQSCHYCGSSIETIGLDRVSNNNGYTIDNIVSCCSKCNLMKHILNKEDFIKQCKKIVQFQRVSIS